ncbi:hypothetical protein ACJX0J_033642, partial [Zea mays]
PGCSSVGYGAASELGPLLVNSNGTGLEFNKFAWNKEANLLFLESPVGVGFSYTNTSSDLENLDDRFVANDTYTFLVNWFNRFPQYRSHDFYISGESYAGHYVPQLAEVVYEHNKHLEAKQRIHLKGFIAGNAETDDYYDYTGMVEFAWSHTVISDQLYERVKTACDFRLSPTSTECGHVMDLLYHTYDEIDIYNVYAPKCNTDDGSAPLPSSSSSADDSSASSKQQSKRRLRMYSGYDPCYSSYVETYFNRMDVQKSLHANTSGRIRDRRWSLCSDPVFDIYDMEVFSVLPIYSKLVKAGLKIWVYSGDVDGRVPVIGSRYWVEALGLPIKSQWQPWYLKDQVAGRYREQITGIGIDVTNIQGGKCSIIKISIGKIERDQKFTSQHTRIERVISGEHPNPSPEMANVVNVRNLNPIFGLQMTQHITFKASTREHKLQICFALLRAAQGPHHRNLEVLKELVSTNLQLIYRIDLGL